jgi:hypothetical protein
MDFFYSFVGGLRMRRPKRIDLVSLLSGVAAVPLASTGVYLRSVRVPGSGTILTWLDKLGLVRQSPPEAPSVIVFDLPSHERLVSVGGVPEMSDPGRFPVNDESAIVFLLAVGVALALVAMSSAVWAEYRREPTLYLSVGYICGVLAVAQVWLLAGLVAAIMGVAAVLVMRNRRGC